MLMGLLLPDGASLERTEAALSQVAEIARKTPGVDHVVAISGMSVLDSNNSLANGGVCYIIFKDWSVRAKQPGQDLRSIVQKIARASEVLQDGRAFPLVPPAIQGVGNAGGFQMQVEQRDGTFDYVKLQNATDNLIAQASTQSGLANLVTSFRAGAPHIRVEVDRVKAQTLKVSIGEVFDSLSAYVGSAYVNRFNKFGLTLLVFQQAEAQYRLKSEDILRLQVKNSEGQMVPIGALATLHQSSGSPLISLYNLYPSAAVVGASAPGFSSGESIALMDEVANATLPPGTSYEWTAMSYQENIVGNQIMYVFGLAILLVYLCLAGQYESWILPLAVISAVPLALIGPALSLGALGMANNLYTQIGLMLLIALAAKNAILIVEVAREARLLHGKPILDAAVEAARTRFRPILMTSFAFILGVVPLVTATGAGANSRVSLGMAVFSGMIASTCLAVLFVPSFFVVLQRFEEWRKSRKAPKPAATAAEPSH
jgi:HAE1 family hydrophobic/amphiphilic exporter-1